MYVILKTPIASIYFIINENAVIFKGYSKGKIELFKGDKIKITEKFNKKYPKETLISLQ